MIIKNRFCEDLESAITSGHFLTQIMTRLRASRDVGVSRLEAQAALDTLRSQAIEEVAEDRNLEVMDIVGGFCHAENTVWDD